MSISSNVDHDLLFKTMCQLANAKCKHPHKHKLHIEICMAPKLPPIGQKKDLCDVYKISCALSYRDVR